jgi:hypothetical protein
MRILITAIFLLTLFASTAQPTKKVILDAGFIWSDFVGRF